MANLSAKMDLTCNDLLPTHWNCWETADPAAVLLNTVVAIVLAQFTSLCDHPKPLLFQYVEISTTWPPKNPNPTKPNLTSPAHNFE